MTAQRHFKLIQLKHQEVEALQQEINQLAKRAKLYPDYEEYREAIESYTTLEEK